MSQPPFRVPPAAGSRSQKEVPAFLKGDNGPTYRASGGGGDDFDNHPSSNMFAVRSRSPSLNNMAPAPLKFREADPFSRPSQAYQGWAQGKSKKLDQGLWERPTVTDTFEMPTLSKLAIAPRAKPTFDSDTEEADDTFTSASWARPFATLRLACVGADETDVLQNITHAFSRAVDFELVLASRKINGVVYDKCDRCQFTLQIIVDEGAYLVDFQRRAGPQRLFSSFFASTVASLGSVDLFTSVEHLPSARGAAGLSGGDAALPTSGGTSRPALDEESCVQLVDMCDSGFEDVRLEAFRTLMPFMKDLSKDIHQHCGPKLVQIMVRAGNHGRDGEDLKWCLSYLAAHMCALPEFAKHAVLLTPLIFSMLNAPPSLAGRGTQRQAARALLLITKADPRALLGAKEVDSYFRVLERLVVSADPSLQSSVKSVLDQLCASM